MKSEEKFKGIKNTLI